MLGVDPYCFPVCFFSFTKTNHCSDSWRKKENVIDVFETIFLCGLSRTVVEVGHFFLFLSEKSRIWFWEAALPKEFISSSEVEFWSQFFCLYWTICTPEDCLINRALNRKPRSQASLPLSSLINIVGLKWMSLGLHVYISYLLLTDSSRLWGCQWSLHIRDSNRETERERER